MSEFTPEQQQQIEELFCAANTLPDDARAAFLSARTADPALLTEVERLLNAFKDAGRFMETDALNAAAKQEAASQANGLVGHFLSHYEILEILGRGGMGEVYRARDSRLGREVAVKVLPSGFASDQDLLSRFQQEARAASALNHQNILIVHDLGEANSTPFIATELIRGITLGDRLDQGQLSLGESLRIAIQIADALVAAHSARIIHRDIKPANVMLREDGTVKILDFGVAKFIERLIKQESSTAGALDPGVVHTAQGSFIGTYQYASPEQLQGQDTDERTDVWSLGVVLYEMIAGNPPFKGSSAEELKQAILSQEPPPLEGFSLEVSNELQRISAKALSKDRARQYQTIKEMFVDLKTLHEQVEFAERTGLARGDQGLFIGEKRLQYLMSWRMSERVGLPVFNWPAFLVPLPWLAYRKMYFYLGAIVAFTVAFCVLIERAGVTDRSFLLLVMLGLMIGVGVFGNTLYRRHIVGKLRGIKQKGLESQQQMALIKRTGGTSNLAGALMMVLVLGGVILIPKYLVFPQAQVATDRTREATVIADEANLLLSRSGNLLIQAEVLSQQLQTIQDPENESERIRALGSELVKLLTQAASLARESSSKFDRADKLLDQGKLKKHFTLMTQAALKYSEMSELARQQAEVLLKAGSEPMDEIASRYEQFTPGVQQAAQEAITLTLEGRQVLANNEVTK